MLRRGYFYNEDVASDTQAAINVIRNVMLRVDYEERHKTKRDRGTSLLFRAKWRLTLLQRFGSMRGARVVEN